VIEEANQHLFKLMHEHEEALGMGTTLLGTLLTADQVVTFNVGDSRCYPFSAGQLVQLSYDDVPEGENNHFGRRRSHALTQALGGSSFPVAINPTSPSTRRLHPERPCSFGATASPIWSPIRSSATR
jgi:PPM family protein phosphatase